MKRFLKYLKPYIKECILAPLFKMLEASFELLVPLVIADLVDKGIGTGNRGTLLLDGGLLFLLALVGLTAAITAQYFSAKAATRFGQAVRNDLFRHIENLSYSNIDSIGSSTLITRMTSDVNQMQTGVNMILRLFLRSPFIVFGAIFMAYRVSHDYLPVFAEVVGALFVIVFAIILTSIPLIRKVQQRLDTVTLHTRENIKGARVIRAFNREDEEEEEFVHSVKRLTRMQLIVGRISALLNPVTFAIINIGIVIVLYSGGIDVRDGELATGDVVALVEYMSMILVELIKLANFIITVSRMFAGAKRVAVIFDTAPDQSYPETGKKGDTSVNEITFTNVSMRYKDAADDALKDVTFTARRGETIGIIGGTGSGKSTLVNLIPRFYDATEGEILIDGVDIRSYARNDIRGKVAVVPQKAALFKGSIADNLRWGREGATDEEVDRAIELSVSEEFVSAKEGGKNYEISEGARNLSGGQKQRLTIARALVKDSGILILDDSSSALDFATDARLRKNLEAVKADRIIFVVSQRASTIMRADRILVLDKGNLVGSGTHESLLKDCDIYREICLSQMSKEEVTA